MEGLTRGQAGKRSALLASLIKASHSALNTTRSIHVDFTSSCLPITSRACKELVTFLFSC